MIRVLLVDDHAVVRVGLRALIGAAADIDVIGEAADGAAALRLAAELRPDVVVMDLSMDGKSGADATRELTRAVAAAGASTPRVLVLTMHDEEEYLIPLLEAGASGYIVKSAVSDDLLAAIRTVAQGRVFVRPSAAHVLAAGWTRRTQLDGARERYAALSEREQAVFRLIAQGYSSSQIGERLYISAKTVDTYRRRINEKTGFAERADYIRLAVDLGLLSPSGDA